MAYTMGFVLAIVAVFVQLWTTVMAAPETTLNITAFTSTVDSDWTAVYYSEDSPLLVGNDGSANGGLRAYGFDTKSPLPQTKSTLIGRTKIVTVAHNVGGKDLAITIAAPDSIIRVFELPDFRKADEEFTLIGDWSAMCSWKTRSRNQYFYIFGKGRGVQFLIRPDGEDFEIVEIQSFDVPFEPSGCAVSESTSLMFLHGDDSTKLYAFPLEESTNNPTLSVAGETLHDLTGVAVYHTQQGDKDLILAAQEDTLAVYEAASDMSGSLQGTIKLEGYEDIEVFGLSVLQSPIEGFSQGALAFGIETDEQEGYGVASLEGVFEDLDLEVNTSYRPGGRLGCVQRSPICKTCGNYGYCIDGENPTCDCFAGHAGSSCQSYRCRNDCNGKGQCVGANQCKCDKGWGGIDCSFLLVEPSYETDANGGDGDDPAIWISKEKPEEMSRIITTVKSESGAGLGVYDLKGKLVQHFDAPQPNNVDMIYDFDMGDRKVDLAFAACRSDDTLCLYEMLPNGTLTSIPGGDQPTPEDYTVYGSCVYRSPKTSKQYLFVNEKSARYLQYELTAKNGVLQTELVRDFKGGNGGQVEGCVVDEVNGWLFLGEEPSALWRYGAEPDSDDEERMLVAEVGDGQLYGDVEGVTLVYGPTADEGFVIVSCQGVSAYNIYRRSEPHDYVTTFTITKSGDGEIDAVTNTDGLAAVGRALGPDFPYGLLVVHDDANQLPDGTTSEEASFKIVALDKVLGAGPLKELGLLKEVDREWDPRALGTPQRSKSL
ncbi:phytase domain-containing protein [Sarocladium implicatum]|nr:phytase domain-containing protein [Sarocladium implicatum]